MSDVVSLCQRRERDRRGRVVDVLLADSVDGECWAMSYLLAEVRAATERQERARDHVLSAIRGLREVGRR